LAAERDLDIKQESALAVVVLAHGGWSDAWAWRKIRTLMAAAGHEFFAPTYTGLGERAHLANPRNDLDLHIGDVLGVVRCEDLHNVMLIGHSYGGIVATGVADQARDRVAKLIYLDAFVPEDGQALIDFLPASERERLLGSAKSGDGWGVTPNPIPPDTSPEDVEWITRFRMAQSVNCFKQPIRLSTALTLPRYYIHCTLFADQTPFTQFAKAARAAGWPVYELNASHSPNVTAPLELMQILQQAIVQE